jgi:hypothetical protein
MGCGTWRADVVCGVILAVGGIALALVVILW